MMSIQSMKFLVLAQAGVGVSGARIFKKKLPEPFLEKKFDDGKVHVSKWKKGLLRAKSYDTQDVTAVRTCSESDENDVNCFREFEIKSSKLFNDKTCYSYKARYGFTKSIGVTRIGETFCQGNTVEAQKASDAADVQNKTVSWREFFSGKDFLKSKKSKDNEPSVGNWRTPSEQASDREDRKKAEQKKKEADIADIATPDSTQGDDEYAIKTAMAEARKRENNPSAKSVRENEYGNQELTQGDDYYEDKAKASKKSGFRVNAF